MTEPTFFPNAKAFCQWLQVNAGSATELVLYSDEQAQSAELSAAELREFKRNKVTWQFFEGTLPGYKDVMLHWVTSAKRLETRANRLAKLLEASGAVQRLR